MQAFVKKSFFVKLKNISWIIAIATLLSACDALTGRETAGQYIDDTGITASVKSAIVQEPTLKTFEIGVETMKGVVQLSGFVDSKSEVETAGRVARNIEGVKSVKNSLSVRKKA